MLGWLASLVGLLSVDLGHVSWLALAAALVGRTVLQTGLFIVGHDAMHGVLLTGGASGTIGSGPLLWPVMRRCPMDPAGVTTEAITRRRPVRRIPISMLTPMRGCGAGTAGSWLAISPLGK